MKLENIIKRLENEGLDVTTGQFDSKPCQMCLGTALVDLVNGEMKDTSARYKDVLIQVFEKKSHIYTVENKKKVLTTYNKLGY